MTTNQNIDALVNSTVYDRDGDKIGSVGQLYLDDNTGQPSWVTVSTGFFGTQETFVPLKDATISGDEVRVPYEKSFVKDAPNVDVDQHLSPAEEEELYRYYKLEGGTAGTHDRDHDRTRTAAAGTAGTAGTAATAGTHDRDFDRDRTAGTDRDHDGKESLVAHEERLNVGTERREAGQARLRKHVVNETQRVEVPVQREELHVEREKLSGDRASNHTIGKDTTEETITLHEERPVVEKETVATERVNVGKETVTDTETVQANTKREEIEVDTDGTGTRGTTGRTGDRDGDGDRDLKDKIGDKLDRDNDGKIGR
ncbi:PRC and DUF2382 domain-containing protein [Mariniluteicoccus flavus]